MARTNSPYEAITAEYIASCLDAQGYSMDKCDIEQARKVWIEHLHNVENESMIDVLSMCGLKLEENEGE